MSVEFLCPYNHVLVHVLGGLTILAGLFTTKFLCHRIMTTLGKQQTKTFIEVLFIALVSFDLIACLGSITSSSLVMAIIELGNSAVLQVLVYISTFASYFGRTGSYLVSGLIIIQRCRVLHNSGTPTAARRWMSNKAAKVLLVLVVLLATFQAVVRIMMVLAHPDDPLPNFQNLSNSSLIMYNKVGNTWYEITLFCMDASDFFFPLPLHLGLNLWLFREAREVVEGRKAKNFNFQLGLDPVKTVRLPMTIALYSHAVPIIYYSFAAAGVIYMELFIMVGFSMILSSLGYWLNYLDRGKELDEKIRRAGSKVVGGFTIYVPELV